ncbi:MAG: hypothetical protein M1832_004256 [Thelocarpon impressellum]|nr:MAG: hypothetical protein M1832_004256 [Thelocarpon impressellum]
MMTYPEPFAVPPTAAHTHTCILLHGRGGDGPAFGAMLLVSPAITGGPPLRTLFPEVKFVLPTTCKRRAAALDRMPIRQWFDIFSLVDTAEREGLQVEGLRETAAHVHGLIGEEERAGIPRERIFLGGLSQGCAAAVHALLTLGGGPLAGFVGMSGWFPFAAQALDILKSSGVGREEKGEDEEDVFESASSEPQDLRMEVVTFLRDNIDLPSLPPSDSLLRVLETRVLLGHGGLDEKVAPALGARMADVLGKLGMDVRATVYPQLGHWYQVPEQVGEIAAFLREGMQLHEG